MEYIPSEHEQQMYRFFNQRKRALILIKKLELSLPYISDKLTYDQLFLEYSVKNFENNNNETEYLKDGIKSLIECLKEVRKYTPISVEEAEAKVTKKRVGLEDYILKNGKDEHALRWINQQVDFEVSNDTNLKRITEEVLIREIAEFKTRLGRVNVTVIIENDALQFKDKKRMEQLIIYSKEIIENPHAGIFSNEYSFAFFEHLYSVFYDKNSKELFADFSMIYRRMHSDGFILEGVRPTDYIKWIQKNYDISLGSSLKKAENPLKIRFYEKLKILR
jgi:hypothetical protein